MYRQCYRELNKLIGTALISGISAFGFNISVSAGVADFYKGKTVKIYVGAGAGGGYGFFGRAFGKFYGQYIPGKPNVIVINKPGAGGTKMTKLTKIHGTWAWSDPPQRTGLGGWINPHFA